MNVLGLMSGSSLDGLDMALCSFEGIPGDRFIFHTLKCQEVEFPTQLIKRLKDCKVLNTQELLKLEADFSLFLGQECKKFIADSNFNVHLICSHGHTVYHYPEHNYTLQIGNGGLISQIAERDVVSDVRSSDIGAGGEGAPFAPLADFHLFSESGICINLGGISNITFQNSSDVIAFDVSPCNQLLNHLSERLNLSYDEDGKLASQGVIIKELSKKLMDSNKFDFSGPRSIDNGWVEKTFFPIIDEYSMTKDVLRTCTDFIISELVQAIKGNMDFVETKKALVTGGGALNSFLMNELEKELILLEIEMEKASEKKIKFKEAILMSLLGYLRVKNIPNAFSSVTGATRDTIGGALYIY